MMKVLLAHNFYRSNVPSGENAVVESEISLLQRYGHHVELFSMYSDAIAQKGWRGVLSTAMLTPWNPIAARGVSHQTVTAEADVVHVHNTFPLLSPSVFRSIGRNAARVLTLHNYRLFCPAAIPMRNGSVCTQCLDKKSSIPAVVHGCYRGSRLATLPLAFSVGLHRAIGTWLKHVDAFICLSDFQRELLVKAGLPREKVHVKPNFYPGNPSAISWDFREPRVVFAGRLSKEKGVVNLLRAWRLWGKDAPELSLVGDGPLRGELERMAVGLPVRFLGQLPAEQAQSEIANARLLILPSEGFEGFPMVIREAFAFGTPCAVSSIGSLPDIVKDGKSGVVFHAYSPQSMVEVVRKVWETPGLLPSLGKGARSEFESKYTEEANYSRLMDIYRSAINVSRHG